MLPLYVRRLPESSTAAQKFELMHETELSEVDPSTPVINVQALPL